MAENEPVILHRSQHCVSRRDIDPDAIRVLYRLKDRGYQAFLVGGGVRDLLLGRHPKDFDIGTNAHPGEIKKLFRNSILIGRRFRLVHILFRDKAIEVSTFRRDPEREETPDGDDSVYQHRDNTFGTADEDARRRDFTINGMFYDIATFGVIDHVGGLADLERKQIRCIGDPNLRFREDPVRMIRAVRFASRLGFMIEPQTYDALLVHHAEIQNASPARLLDEMYKLFLFGSGQRAFKLLYKTGLLRMLFPELSDYLDGVASEDALLWRHLSALDAGLTTLAKPTPPLMLGALFFSLFQHTIDGLRRDGRPVRGDDVARELLKPVAARFGMPKWIFYRMADMFDDQRRFLSSQGRRFSPTRFARREGFAESLALYEIDLVARGKDLAPLEPWKELAAKAGPSGDNTARPSEQRRAPRRRRRGPRRGRRRPGAVGGQGEPGKSEETA